MKNLNLKFKNFIPLIFYWLAFIIIFVVALVLGQNGRSDNFDFSGYLSFYLLFLHPFLFFIPLYLLELKKASIKIFLTILFLIIPYIAIYIYTYNGLREAFGSMAW